MYPLLLKVIYHPLYGMNMYVLIWGDWLSCDPIRGSHDSQSPHIRKHLVATLIYLSQNYSYYIRGDRSRDLRDMWIDIHDNVL